MQSNIKSIHFVGIGGIGMSGLAQMAHAAGFQVSGSDRGSDRPENARIIGKLREQGIAIFPQDGSFVNHVSADLLIYSTAIEADNPDFLAAPDAPRMHRSELLSQLIADSGSSVTVAVTGSCGKSTVCAYLAETLLNAGEDPACLNGALVNNFRRGEMAGNFRQGDGKFFIFEADESDKSLVNYHPDYAIVLNIGTDHYSKEELSEVFGRFLNNVKRGAVLERHVYELVRGALPPELPVAVFESEVGAAGEFAVKSYRRVTITDAVYVNGRRAKLAPSGDRAAIDNIGMTNMLEIYGMRSEECRLETTFPGAEFADGAMLPLPQPGVHMALNALAIYAFLRKFFPEMEQQKVLRALSDFGGVWRRFDFAGTAPSGALVYDDYAHNPEKIISAINGCREVGDGRIFAVFQPHGYGPLGFMRQELFRLLEDTLRAADEFIMLEPYYAGGTSSFKPSAAEVIAEYRAMTRRKNYQTFPDRDTLTDYLLLKSKPSDVILIMGARDNSLSDYAISLTGR